MHLRRTRMVAASVLLAGASLATAPLPAQAATDAMCDVVVIDATASQALGDTSSIEAAATKLGTLGADVRVRAFETAADAGGSLDAYRDKMVDQCPTWRSPDGTLKGNILVYMMSMDRKSAIFYGGNWRDELEDEVDYLRGTVMGDQFRNADFAGGFTKVIDATYDTIYTQQNPAPEQPGESFGNTTFGRVLVWLLVAAFSVGLLVFLTSTWRSTAQRRRDHKAAVAKAQDLAIKARNKAVDALSSLSVYDTIDTDVELITADLNPEDTLSLTALHKFYNTFVNDAYGLNGELSDAGDVSDPDKVHTVDEYEYIAGQYRDLEKMAQQAAKQALSVESTIAELRREMAEAPVTLVALKERVTTNYQKHDQDEAEGYKPLSRDKIVTAEELINAAESNIASGRLGAAIGNLENAEEQLEKDSAMMKQVQELRSSVVTDLHALRAEEQQIKKTLDAAPGIVETLLLKYDPEAVKTVGATAMVVNDTHIRACELIETAEMLSSARTQNWEEAARVADEAHAVLDPVHPLAYSITSSGAKFAEQLADAPLTINALRSWLADAESEISGFRGKHEKRLSKLSSISSELDKVDERLHVDRPNPPLIMAQVDDLTQSAEDVLAEAAEIDRKIRKREDDERREAERRRREREEQEEADRRRRSSSSDSFTGGVIGGYIGGSSSGSHSGGFDSGGGSSGGWGGGSDSGGSSGGW